MNKKTNPFSKWIKLLDGDYTTNHSRYFTKCERCKIKSKEGRVIPSIGIFICASCINFFNPNFKESKPQKKTENNRTTSGATSPETLEIRDRLMAIHQREKEILQNLRLLKNSPSKNSPSHTIKIIAENVSANELIFKSGYMLYRDYTFRSKRIQPVSKEVLSKINLKFSLQADYREPNSFYFYPASDLTKLLTEIKYIMEDSDRISSIPKLNQYPKDGNFNLPWDFVLFYDGMMYLLHPKTSKRGTITPFRIKHQSIRKSFRDIIPYIKQRCKPFNVSSKDGVIISVNNFKDFNKIIPQLTQHVQLTENEIVFGSFSLTNNSFSINEFRGLTIIKKSPYLQHLSRKQDSKHRIYYLLENVVHSNKDASTEEYGYLFTLKNRIGHVTLVFENVSDDSRSSLVFDIDPLNLQKAIKTIHELLASDEINKRQKIAAGVVSFSRISGIKKISRIIHNDFHDWKIQLDRL